MQIRICNPLSNEYEFIYYSRGRFNISTALLDATRILNDHFAFDYCVLLGC